MIRVRKLVKSFGDHLVLRQVDLDVAQGECLSLVGPNGAGKTTLLRVLAALSKPSSGSVRVAGAHPASGANEIRRRVGFLSHHPLLYGDLSGEENLRFYGRMYDVAGLEERIAGLLHQVGLTRRRQDLVRTYSRGMRQRLAIARALLHDPPVLLLDEPYTGLDLQAAEGLDAMLREASVGSRTVLLTTHNLEQGLRRSHRAAIMINGTVTYQMDKKDWSLDGFREEYDRQVAGISEPRR
jgi:heme exporter protein A